MEKKPQNQTRQIATQSQSKLILDWAGQNKKSLTLKELVAITNVMVDYVEFGYSKELGERLDSIQDHLDKKPYPIKDSVSFNYENKGV